MHGRLIIPVTDAPLNCAVINITVEYDSQGLIRLTLDQTEASAKNPDDAPQYPYLEPFTNQLAAYLKGRTTTFTNIPLHLPPSATHFQKTVWFETSLIPYGTVTTYSQLAQNAVGNPSYARAVGGALRANPLPIVIPCHRVLAANGSLGGFNAGLDVKTALLAVERALPIATHTPQIRRTPA